MTRQRAFIASPFGAIAKAHPAKPHRQIIMEAQRIARLAARYVWKELGYIPFSPVLAYGDVFDEFNPETGEAERAAAVEACELELQHSDVFIWTECPYTHLSDNMPIEQAKAEALGQIIRIVEVN